VKQRRGLYEKKTIRSARRESFQTGSIKPQIWKNGDKGYTIRYRVRDPGSETGWRYKRENLQGVGGKQAKQILAERLNEVNAINNDMHQHAPSTVFADFASRLWEQAHRRRRGTLHFQGPGLLRV
jgi:hypothetical protein